MEGRASLKVAGGKLLRINVMFQDVIASVKITGDFFLYPEEAVQDIEKAFQGMSVRSTTEEFLQCFQQSPRLRVVEYIGVSPEDIVSTLQAAFLS